MAEQIFDVAVIGGGASGMMATVQAARAGAKVVLLEAQQRMGRKLLATGNGRCNLTNRLLSVQNYHGDRERAAAVWEKYPPAHIIQEFHRMGLLCRELEEGRIYPYSLQAATVQKLLLRLLEKYRVEIRCDFRVQDCLKRQSFFEISSSAAFVQAKKVILAAGGLAAPHLGGDRSGYEIAQKAGHTVTPLIPALVQLTVSKDRVKTLKGARAPVSAALVVDGKVRKKVSGEVLFAESALSGICIFELSRAYGALPEREKKSACVRLDFMPDYQINDIKQLLRTIQNASFSGIEVAEGLLNRLVAQEIVRCVFPQKEITPDVVLNPKQLSQIAAGIKQFEFPVTGTLGWKNAQVTAGGIPLKEIDVNTMESRLCPGLYFAGEILNIDGDCGGYNLHWAWSTGIIAGKAAAYKG